MAFTEIDSEDIEVGKPTKKKLFTAIKDSLDDHEDRINSVESNTSKIQIFNGEIVNLQQYTNFNTMNRVMTFRAQQRMRISNVQIYVLASSSGNLPTGGILEFDIRKSSDINNMITIFTSKPSITDLTEGSTNSTPSFVTNGDIINEGEWVTLDITSLQDNQSRIFLDIFAEPEQ